MLHQMGDDRPIEFWVKRQFPECELTHFENGQVQIIEKVPQVIGGEASFGIVEASPRLQPSDLLIWLDGRNSAGH